MKSQYSVGIPIILFMRINGIVCDAVTVDGNLKPQCRDRSPFVFKNLWYLLVTNRELQSFQWIWLCMLIGCFHI